MNQLGSLVAIVPLVVSTAAAENLCFVPSSAGLNLSVTCETPHQAVGNWWTGYGESGPEQCEDDGCEPNDIDCGCSADAGAHWSLSRSDVDPYDGVGPLSSPELYPWMLCSAYESWVAAEFALGGTLSVASFEPVNGFGNAGPTGDLWLSHESGCLPAGSGAILVGVVHLAEPSAVNPQTWGRTKARYLVN